LDSCWYANPAKEANRIDAQRERLTPILIIFLVECLGTRLVAMLAPRGISTRTNNFVVVYGILDAESNTDLFC